MKIIHILDMIIDKLRALNRKVDSNMEEVQQSIIETKESEIEYKEELEELAEQIVEQTKEYSESAEANAEQTAQDREYVEGAVTTAEEYSESARHSMQDALLSEQACLSAKEAVTTAKSEVEGLRVLTESYAKGGTGSRTGEDTDNAEYYYEKTRDLSDGFEVIDNLTSTSTTHSLSANMGRELKSQLEDFKDEKGEANGYAELDSNGRVPYSQLPESAMEFKGTWNASTNTPTLTQGVGTNGDFYVVSVGGTWQGITFIANERIIFDGSAHQWIRLSTSGEVVASNVTYNNATSGLLATDVQNAIDEVNSENLIPYPYYTDSNPYVYNETTFTVQEDGSVRVDIDGTTTTNANFYFVHQNERKLIVEKGKTYTLSGGYTTGGGGQCIVLYEYDNNGTSLASYVDYGGGVTFTTKSNTAYVMIRIHITTGISASNWVVKPMLVKGTVKHAYQPTTESLTNKVNKSDLLNLIYPVGSLYMSVNNTSPQTLFGGTWQQIKDRFLLSAGDTYTAGSTGGSATHTPSGTVGNHTLTIAEMPAHSHQTSIWYNAGGGTSHYAPTSGNMTAQMNTYNTGGGQGHNHGFTGTSQNTMPPYLTVYVWKRTA